MEKTLDEMQSVAMAEQVKSKAQTPFDNTYRAALATADAVYVQGFLVLTGKPYKPIEHSWIEVGDRIIDPNFSLLHKPAHELFYFPAQRLTVKRLKAAIEEAKEDYPEDDPLPIYGDAPYEYYGDVMLGGKAYLEAFEAAKKKCQQLNRPIAESN